MAGAMLSCAPCARNLTRSATLVVLPAIVGTLAGLQAGVYRAGDALRRAAPTTLS
jgi:hypothetical protein